MTDKVDGSKKKQTLKKSTQSVKVLPKKRSVAREEKLPPPQVSETLETENVASKLKSLRAQKKVSLAKVAAELRIREDYLIAIEENILEQLPEKAYTLGFVRSYANYLGLDGGRVVKDYKLEQFAADNSFELGELSSQSPEQTMPSRGILIGACIALFIALTLGWWLWVKESPPHNLPEGEQATLKEEEGKPSSLPFSPEEKSNGSHAGPLTSVKEIHINAEPTLSGDKENLGAQPSEQEAPAEGAAETPEKEQVMEPEASSSSTQAESANPQEIILQAQERSWVYVAQDKGKILLNRVLEKGQTVSLPLGQNYYLSTGSAGALSFELEGRKYKLSGKIGDVRRHIPLEKLALLKQVKSIE